MNRYELTVNMLRSLVPATPTRRASPSVGRNAPCPCGSGRKHKHCCLNRASDGVRPGDPIAHLLPPTDEASNETLLSAYLELVALHPQLRRDRLPLNALAAFVRQGAIEGHWRADAPPSERDVQAARFTREHAAPDVHEALWKATLALAADAVSGGQHAEVVPVLLTGLRALDDDDAVDRIDAGLFYAALRELRERVLARCTALDEATGQVSDDERLLAGDAARALAGDAEGLAAFEHALGDIDAPLQVLLDHDQLPVPAPFVTSLPLMLLSGRALREGTAGQPGVRERVLEDARKALVEEDTRLFEDILRDIVESGVAETATDTANMNLMRIGLAHRGLAPYADTLLVTSAQRGYSSLPDEPNVDAFTDEGLPIAEDLETLAAFYDARGYPDIARRTRELAVV